MFDLTAHLTPDLAWRKAGGAGGVTPAFQADFTGLTSLPSWLSFSRATAGTYLDASGVLQTAAIDAPRFDHAWSGSAWVATGLMDEEQRTNLALNSQLIGGTNWNPGSTTLTTNTGDLVSPDGTNNATKIVTADGSNNAVFQTQSGLNANGRTWTVSFWAKVNSGTFNLPFFGDDDAGTFFFNPASVTVPLTTTWQRFTLTATYSGATTTLRYGFGGFGSLTAAVTFYVFGFQIEQAGFASSYIPTTTAAVTRSADIVQPTGAALAALQGSAGSLLIQTERVKNWPAGCEIVQFKAAAGNDDIYASLNTTAIYYQSGNKITATLGSGSFDGGQVRLGFSWDGTGTSLVGNGGTVGTSATVLSTDSGMYLGSAGSNYFIDGYINSIAIYSSRLSDADLQTKSVVGAAF